jgi:hypothetical protein
MNETPQDLERYLSARNANQLDLINDGKEAALRPISQGDQLC